MALMILFLIYLHFHAIGINGIEQVPCQEGKVDEFGGIRLRRYLYDDNIVLLQYNNFFENILNSTRAWIVQFYNSENNEWMKYYLAWKHLAQSIYPWKNIVVTATIDCSCRKEAELCQKFKILNYPTFRYFSPKLKAINCGKTIPISVMDPIIPPSFTNLIVLRREVIKCLQDDETKMSNWPDFSPINLEDFESVKNTNKNHLLVLVVETSTSYVGRQLMLDLWSVENVTVRYSLDIRLANRNRKLPQAFAVLPKTNDKFHDNLGATMRPILSITDATRYLVFKTVQFKLKEWGYTVPDFKESLDHVYRIVQM